MKQMEQALMQLTGERATIMPFDTNNRLSLYLAASYEFFLTNVLDIRFLLVKPTEERKIPQIKIQFQQLKEIFGYEAVLFEEQLTQYKKNRLIEERIGFMCSDKQIFLPFMFVSLQNKRTKTSYITSDETYTASMQLIFLSILYSSDSIITQESLSRKLGISCMTVSRTLEKFVHLKLLDYTVGGKTGRQKIYHCNDKKVFYQIGKAGLINPVSERFFVNKIPENVRSYVSGLSALSERSLLAQPDHPVVAISHQYREAFLPYQVPWEIGSEKQLTEVEVMKYDIGLLTKDNCIDVISMISSLKITDERVEIAIESSF